MLNWQLGEMNPLEPGALLVPNLGLGFSLFLYKGYTEDFHLRLSVLLSHRMFFQGPEKPVFVKARTKGHSPTGKSFPNGFYVCHLHACWLGRELICNLELQAARELEADLVCPSPGHFLI